MDAGHITPRLLSRTTGPDRDTSPDELGRYQPPQSQIPRTLPSPTPYTADGFEDQTMLINEQAEHHCHGVLEPLSRSLGDAPGFEETTGYFHQISRGILRRGHICGSPQRPETTSQPTNSAPNHDLNADVRFGDYLLHLQHVDRRPTRTNEEPSDKVILSDSIVNGAGSNTEVAIVDGIGNDALPNSPHLSGSSAYLSEGALDTSTALPYLETAQERQLIIQRLMSHVTEILQTKSQSRNEVTRRSSAPFSNPTRYNVTSSRTDNGTTRSSSSTKQPAPPNKRRKLNQQSNGKKEEDKGEKDEEQEKQALYEALKDKQKEGLLFACPYAKHDRSRYSQSSCFNGHGWPSVARIKEHLYRRHQQPTHCPRCQALFEETNALVAHQREQPPCRLLGGTTVEGFDSAQEKALKSRAGLCKMSEHEKWRKIYKILFPHVAEAQIPSPYYEPDYLQNLADHIVQDLSLYVAHPLVESLRALGLNLPPAQIAECVKAAMGRGLENLLRIKIKRPDSQSLSVQNSEKDSSMAAGAPQQLLAHQEDTFTEASASGSVLDIDNSDLNQLTDLEHEEFWLSFDTPVPLSVMHTFSSTSLGDPSMDHVTQ